MSLGKKEDFVKILDAQKGLWKKFQNFLNKVSPTWLSSFYLKQSRPWRIGIPIVFFLFLLGSIISIQEEGWGCGKFFEILFGPFIGGGYIFGVRWFGKRYAKWFWPEYVRDRMLAYKENVFNNESFKYENRFWTPHELTWRRIRDVSLGGIIPFAFPMFIVFSTFLSILDKVIVGAQCNFLQ